MNSLFVFHALDVSAPLLIFASLLDALFGSHWLLGRVPGPDRAIRLIIDRLNRMIPLYEQGWAMGTFLGIMVCSILLSVAFLGGQYGDQAPNSDYWIGGKSVVLALLIGQRTTIDTSLYLFKRLRKTMVEGVSGQDQKGQFAAARWSVERTVNRFVDGYLCNIFFFVLGGFAWLLAFRVLSVFTALGSPNGVKQSKIPFFFIPSLIYSMLTLFPAGLYIVMVTFIGVIIRPARFFMGPLAFFSRPFLSSIPLRLWALSANAWVLGINLKTDPDGPSSSFNWLGPKGGRARVNPRDVILSILLQIVAWLLILGLLGVTMLRFSA